MTTQMQEVVRLAKRLSPSERERLAGELIAGAESAKLTEIDELWVAEAEARYDAWKAGRTKTVDANSRPQEHCGSRVGMERHIQLPEPNLLLDELRLSVGVFTQ